MAPTEATTEKKLSQSQQVGFSLIAQAHIGLLIAASLLVLSLLFSFSLTTVIYGALFGVFSALLLMAYWLGKGGKFFILALFCPLMAIIFSPLNSFLDVANLICAYFVGLCLVLTAYKMIKGS
jgi:hypothetical protein